MQSTRNVTLVCIVIPLETFVNSSYIFLMALEMQVQHFMYFTCLCTLLTFWVYNLCCTKTWLPVQNCITRIGGRHQFSRRKQILVVLLVLSLVGSFLISEIEIPWLPSSGSRFLNISMAHLIIYSPAVWPCDGNYNWVLAVYSRILCSHGSRQFRHSV